MVELERPDPVNIWGCGGANAATPQQGYFVNSGTGKFWMEQLF